MRQQMAILKEKLEQQQIVNEALVRQSISKRLKRFRHSRWRQALIIVLAITYVPWVLIRVMEMPLWFVVVCEVFFFVAFAYDWYQTAGIDAHDLSTRGLMDIHRRLARAHRMQQRWLWLAIPFVLFFLGCIVWWTKQSAALSAQEINYQLTSILTGAAIGGVIGIILYHRKRRQSESLLSDIEDAMNKTANGGEG